MIDLPSDFLANLDTLADAYLAQTDPIRQSGFGGGAERWRAEREPILDAVQRSGSLVDMGCANGHLLECLVSWGHERGLEIDPYGVDYSDRLVALAQKRLPQWATHFFIENAWTWTPPQPFDLVYSLYDNVPEPLLPDYVRRLINVVASPGGRVIIGAYGSRSKRFPAFEIDRVLADAGLRVGGSITVGDLPEARFAWVDRQ